jgi:hypothetical protein
MAAYGKRWQLRPASTQEANCKHFIVVSTCAGNQLASMKSETAGKLDGVHSNSRPIIVDLGKIGGKKVKQLKKGEGIYIDEVLPAVEQVRASLAKVDEKDATTVVVLYERKRKTLNLFPGLLR